MDSFTYASFTINTPKSSNILAVAWQRDTEILTVTFKGKDEPTIYDFAGVTGEVAHTLIAAPSIGSHFATAIRGKFPSVKREREPLPTDADATLTEKLSQSLTVAGCQRVAQSSIVGNGWCITHNALMGTAAQRCTSAIEAGA